MSPKTKLTPFLVAYVGMLFGLFFLFNDLNWSIRGVTFDSSGWVPGKIYVPAALHLAALVLCHIIPSSLKHRLVFLRWRHPLPGSRAFTKLAPADDRIDMRELSKRYGRLPSDPGEQNRLWYKIYSEKKGDAIVAKSHSTWILLRDMFCISLLLLIPGMVASALLSGPRNLVAYSCLSIGLIALLWLASWNTANRFVCNVLAR